jgi:hypothetical protein
MSSSLIPTSLIPIQPHILVVPHFPTSPVALRVQAIDCAQEFDFEARSAKALKSESKLKIGIVGFGTFGRFLAARFAARGHDVLATGRTAPPPEVSIWAYHHCHQYYQLGLVRATHTFFGPLALWGNKIIQSCTGSIMISMKSGN